jgi:hypothetical protein
MVQDEAWHKVVRPYLGNYILARREQNVERFARAALLRGRWRLMAASLVSFYGDESGSHGDGPFVLSGYLGRDDAWSDFERQWHDALCNGKPIDFFHMRECFKLEGQFAGWNRFQADRKLNDLIDVLRPFLLSKRIREFTAILDWDIYDRTIKQAFREYMHSPYLFNIRAIQQNVAHWMERNKETSPAYFVFDDQTSKVERSTQYQFYQAKATLLKSHAQYVDSVTFKSDEFCYPLQAADLIAWQRHRRELNLPIDRGPLPAFKRLVNATEGELMRHREDRLAANANEIDDGLRAQGLIPRKP